MTNLQYVSAIQKLIEGYETIIIHRHIIPDGDAYGSQLGLKELIKTNYPNKEVYAVGEDINYLKFIGLMDKNIIDEKYKNALVIVTDCGNVERIDNQRFKLGKHLLKIDHHPNATPYGDTSWVDVTFTSASEMVGYLAQQLNWKVSPTAGRIIYHGILTDSLRFLIKSTSSRTLEVASWLLKSNFDLGQLYEEMYKRKLSDLKIQAELIDLVKVEDQVGYLIIDEKILNKYQIPFEENGKFSNLLKDVEGIEIWLTFAARADKKWRVEFRSRELAINPIAVKYGGGGHNLASGAIVDDRNTINNVIEDAKKMIKGEFK
ncbi:bifunctional oligoribonuclease and PAP phosphatase NrnA [Williamsoniiplasma somnilux]|uniref:Bifunctional oligoribonuclease and PAP phosphatase NrnA n=1 Tax=Williamsoniiplasma somnilux TaxID=215578 RepID=A0A2K8NXL6_9MOLU|nr:bifunctional oligoribonuclease/PAP phosphatase NrnA [Williamsoniiplasma somnilux]ATZ18560.1 bifunctional oligoribonuclease and PAP phosphatase NrnA [Williamsoniiplasma somnilux]